MAWGHAVGKLDALEALDLEPVVVVAGAVVEREAEIAAGSQQHGMAPAQCGEVEVDSPVERTVVEDSDVLYTISG